MISDQHRKAQAGFTLIEMLLSMVVAGIIIGSAVFLFANLASVFVGETISGDRDFDGDGQIDSIPVAPAYGQLASALQIQVAIQELLQGQGVYGPVSTVFVTGGENENGGDTGGGEDAGGSQANSPLTIWPTGIVDRDESRFQSPQQFRDWVKDKLGSGSESSERNCLYSIYFFAPNKTGSSTSVVANLQIGQFASSEPSGYTLYWVKYYEQPESPSLAYWFAVPTDRLDAMKIQPSAHHFWLRQDEDWNINDYLGAEVILPDPTALPYQMTVDDDVRTFPRFAYFFRAKM